MQKIVIILLAFFIFSQKSSFAQFSKQLDSLCVLCNKSASDSQKVIAMGKLADYYYVYKLDRQADSVLHQQLLIAEHSNNSNLMLIVLFGEAILNIGSSATSESFDKTIQFIQKGIDYAKSANQYNYIALGYDRMSDILRKRGQYDKALSNSVLALSSLQNVTSDSVKIITYIGLGDTYLGRGEAVFACSNYNNAFDIAVKINSVPLESKIHHSISEMYKKLSDSGMASNELNESLILNKSHGYAEGMMMDYFDLARLTNESYFIEKAIYLADSIDNYKYLLNAKRLMLVYYYLIEKNEQKALHYLENEPDLKQSFLNNGFGNYLQAKGNCFFYSGNADSALAYYTMAEPEIAKKFDTKASRNIYEQIGDSYEKLKNYPLAIDYYLKTLQLSRQMNDAGNIASISEKLSTLYARENDFKNAYLYAQQGDRYIDSLNTLSKGNDIALLGVERENKKHQQELLQEQKLVNNKRNIQYMAITVALVVVFFLILFIGSFPVSKLTVKLMGYFFFISLFEFIVLLIDNLFLTHATHNQPLIIWMIKIGLIGLLVPFQHFLETNLISLLASKKLIEVRTKFSVKKWWAKMKKPASVGEEGLEEDAAVL
jgi:predicted nucleic acid-binding Zn finger protein